MLNRNPINSLELRLTLGLSRFRKNSTEVTIKLPEPAGLKARSDKLRAMFDEGTPAEPPSQARINALGKLRAEKLPITRKDWNLISWGLCDDCGRAGMPIESVDMFRKIIQFVENESINGISRKIWFGLLHSYFSYPNERPDQNDNWLELRKILFRTLPALIKNQTRPKAWSRALQNQRELLTSKAGESLGKSLFNGEETVAAEVANYLPIPESSWLWSKIINAQLNLFTNIRDEQLVAKVSVMLSLAKQHHSQSDNILKVVLTRYENSSCREIAHNELKQYALDQWQNPQIKSANRWSLVSDDVRKMMLHWFAKADLEHFFSLLQGEGGVDQARLHYWLRFVDQISYTRIVMGADAYLNRDADFSDFRFKNKGRFSQLSGGDTSNNAFIMKIGDYYFVEFSGTGNACYVYTNSKLPFNPELKHFQLSELKRKPPVALDRILHLGDWVYKTDYLLRVLGIVAGKNNRNTTRSAVPAATSHTSSNVKRKSTIEDKINLAIQLAKQSNCKTEDHRAIGGAFWVISKYQINVLSKNLGELGFSYSNPRGYWIK